MRRVWEIKKRGILYYLIVIPAVIALVIINLVVVSWFAHLLYAIFTDSAETMSFPEWAEHLYGFIKHLIDLVPFL